LNVKKAREGVLLEGSVPSEIAGAEAVELFSLRDGIYLLSIVGRLEHAKGSPANAGQFSEAESALLKKLLAVKFEKRTPDEVDRALLPHERDVLSTLMKKKIVTIFRSQKYSRGVYNVSDAAFGQARHASVLPPQNAPITPSAHDPLSRGWLMLENEGEARELSNAMAGRIKAGAAYGLRAFDRKYYLVSKEFADEWQPRLRAALEKGSKTAMELGSEVGLEEQGCQALLLHMCEQGELLEKNRGKFALA
jgi:hypothetical protein